MITDNGVANKVGSAQDRLSRGSSFYDENNNNNNNNSNNYLNSSKTIMILDERHLDGLQFDLIKISCKKEQQQQKLQDNTAGSTAVVIAGNTKRNLKKLLKFYNKNVKWPFRIILLIICLIVIAYSLYRLLDLALGGAGGGSGLWLMTYGQNYFSRSKRSAANYNNNEEEWSAIRMPSIYEIEPTEFYDSDGDGVGDLNGIKEKLDYLQRNLKTNTILIKHIQSSFITIGDDDEKEWIVDDMAKIFEPLGNETNLQDLIEEIHMRSMKIVIEIDLTSTSTNSSWFKSNFSNDLYFKGDGKRAYLNYDSEKTMDQIANVMNYWCGRFSIDGIYFKDIEKLQVSRKMEKLVFIIRQTCSNEKIYGVRHKSMLIGSFSPNNVSINHFLLDIYRVDLNVSEVFTQLILNKQDSFDFYLVNTTKKLIWSFYGFESVNRKLFTNAVNLTDRHMLKTFYLMLYSLPGVTLIKQGNELGQLTDQRLDHKTKVEEAKRDVNSLVKLFNLFNERIKPKMYDRLEESKLFYATSTTTTKSPLQNSEQRPPPYANSYKSISSYLYLSGSIYGINFANGILKLTRQIDVDQRRRFDLFSLSLKFYRNIIFMMNFSGREYFLENLIKSANLSVEYASDISRQSYPRISMHILYDSSRKLPNYMQLNSPDFHDASVKFEPNQLLVLEL